MPNESVEGESNGIPSFFWPHLPGGPDSRSGRRRNVLLERRKRHPALMEHQKIQEQIDDLKKSGEEKQ
jgi:hypothetical protein